MPIFKNFGMKRTESAAQLQHLRDISSAGGKASHNFFTKKVIAGSLLSGGTALPGIYGYKSSRVKGRGKLRAATLGVAGGVAGASALALPFHMATQAGTVGAVSHIMARGAGDLASIGRAVKAGKAVAYGGAAAGAGALGLIGRKLWRMRLAQTRARQQT